MGSARAGGRSGLSADLREVCRSVALPFRPAVQAVLERRWRAVWLGPAAAVVVTAAALAARQWHPSLLTYAADVPWSQALVRIPLSVAAPALGLPYWGAVLQVLVVLSCAQPLLGARRTLALGLSVHVAVTVAARVLLDHGPRLAIWRSELDTGPSVAVLAVGLLAAVAAGSRTIAGAVAVGVGVEMACLHSLASLEHGLAIALVTMTTTSYLALQAAGDVLLRRHRRAPPVGASLAR